MPTINKALAILAALAFFLPFVTISCNGPTGRMTLVEMSGVKVAKCSMTTCSPEDVLSPEVKAKAGRNIPNMDVNNIPGRDGRDSKVEGGNFVVLAAIACLVAVLTLFVGGRGGELLSGVSSVAAIGLLLMFHSRFGDAVNPNLHSPQMGAAAALMKIELQFAAGFWLSMIMSAASAILAFKGTSRAPSPVTAGGRNSMTGFLPNSPPAPGGGQQMSACPSCGVANSVGNRFCLSCGASLATPSRPEKTGCPSCGAAAVPGGKFCLACGTSLTSKPDVAPQATAAAPQAGESEPPLPAQSAREPAMAPLASAAAAAPTGQPLAATAPGFAERPSATNMVERAVVPTGPPESLSAATPAVQPPVSPTSVNVADNGVDAHSPVSSKPVCPACGAEVGPSQKFCLACGTPVGQPAIVSETPTQTDESATFAPPLATGQDQQGPLQAPSTGSQAWIVVVVLLAVMGVAGWYVWKYFAGPDVTVTTFQKKIHVGPGGRTSLQASVSGSTDTDVDWSIQEGGKGGSITSLGSSTTQGQSHAAAAYTAPQTPGTFHVIATSHANPNRTATVEIVVGGALQPDVVAAPTPASPAAISNPGNSQILGTWRWPTDDRKMMISSDSIVITSVTDPQKNLSGTYRFTDASHLQIDFGNGDVRTWQILGVDNNYLRVLAQSKTENSPTAMIFAKIG